jgi:hypothetical protein
VLDELDWNLVAAIGDGVDRRLVAQQPELRASVTVPPDVPCIPMHMFNYKDCCRYQFTNTATKRH